MDVGHLSPPQVLPHEKFGIISERNSAKSRPPRTTNIEYSRIVQGCGLGCTRRPVADPRQTGQDPPRSHVLVEDFHQTGHLLEQRKRHINQETSKNSVAQACSLPAPSPISAP